MGIICVNNHYVLDLPHFIYVFPYHYEYLHSLPTLDEDTDRANLGNSIGLDSCDFWGHGSYLVEDHVGG